MTKQIQAKVIEDSISPSGKRLTTLQLTYPRFIHGEFMTHRVFSRNSSSSRAIPVSKVIKQVWNDPAMPIHWGANQPGMQAKEQLSGIRKKIARGLWRAASKAACVIAYAMNKVGLHKQVANRVLEPFQLHHVIMTATEFDNFYELRKHPDAQPEIHELAIEMIVAQNASRPKRLALGEWHLPYVTEAERGQFTIETLRKLSAARCARVSYLNHDGTTPNIQKDISLFGDLVGARPLHASPVEHQATPAASSEERSGNFVGWVQFRKLIEATFAAPTTNKE